MNGLKKDGGLRFGSQLTVKKKHGDTNQEQYDGELVEMTVNYNERH